ncbi:MAG: methylmalonyl-CoA mutase family protein [Planctomycetota bacterium]
MATRDEPIPERGTAPLAPLASFPAADRDAWKALVQESLDGRDPDVVLARHGEDGRTILPLATRENLPDPPTAPPSWPSAPPANVSFVGASNADEWIARVDEETARGATGIASISLPRGAESRAGQLLSVGHVLLLEHPPSVELAGAWVLAHDAVARALERNEDRDIGTEIEAAFDRQRSVLRDGRADGEGRHGLVDLGRYARNGASPAQELGLMLATLVEIGRRADEHDLEPTRFLPGFALAFDLSTDVLLSVAKLRAARVVWAKLLIALDVPADVDSRPWIVTRTGERTWSKQDPETNWLRATCQSIAAFLGGADAHRAHAYDRLTANESSPTAVRTARDTASVLALEGHLGRVADPARGSYFVEATTDELAREGWQFFRSLERAGGLAAALASGFARAEIARTRFERHSRLDAGSDVLVGVNRYRRAEDPEVDDPAIPASVGDWTGLRESAPWESER